jgi:hypothetical protein
VRDADGQDRDVVVETVTEACEQIDERLHDFRSSGRRVAGVSTPRLRRPSRPSRQFPPIAAATT